jgi:hypothetical protein
MPNFDKAHIIYPIKKNHDVEIDKSDEFASGQDFVTGMPFPQRS